MSAPENWRFETKQIHSGAQPDPVTKARATPIYQTTSYVFDSADHAANLFALAEFGNIYTRIQNPTQDVVEQRLAALEGGTGALLLASGQAAATFAVLNIAQAGDHIVSSSSIYGGTYNLFKYTLAKLGIEVTFVENQDDPEEWRARGPPEHEALLRRDDRQPEDQRPRHPHRRRRRARERRAADRRQHDRDAVPDPSVRARRRHRRALGDEVPRRPRHHHRRRRSSTAARSRGRRTSTSSPASPSPTPRTTAPATRPRSATALAYIIKARVQLLRDLGAAIAPQSAWLLIQGIETLSLRIERHVQNAQEIAEWLENHDGRRVGQLLGPALLALVRRGERVRPEGRRRGAVVRAQGRRRGRPRVRQHPVAVQPPRQHRRRALARHPPGVDHALAAHARAAAHDRRHAGPRAPLGRPRERRRPQGRPRAGARRGRRVSEAARA